MSPEIIAEAKQEQLKIRAVEAKLWPLTYELGEEIKNHPEDVYLATAEKEVRIAWYSLRQKAEALDILIPKEPNA